MPGTVGSTLGIAGIDVLLADIDETVVEAGVVQFGRESLAISQQCLVRAGGRRDDSNGDLVTVGANIQKQLAEFGGIELDRQFLTMGFGSHPAQGTLNLPPQSFVRSVALWRG